MKQKLFAVFALVASFAGAQTTTTIFAADYNTPTLNVLKQVFFFMPSTFPPQVQVFITETAAAPAGYIVKLNYVDAQGSPHVVTQQTVASAPVPNSNTTTISVFLVDAYQPVQVTSTPVQISGPPVTIP